MLKVKKVSIPTPIKWRLVWDSPELKNTELTKDEIYLIKVNLEMVWLRRHALPNEVPTIHPVSRRLRLDYIAVLQGDAEVFLCRNK